MAILYLASSTLLPENTKVHNNGKPGISNMNLQIKRQPPWLQLIIFGLITIVVAVIISMVGLMIISAITHIGFLELGKLGPEDFSNPKYAGVAKGLLVVQFFGIFLAPSLLFAWLSDSRPFAFAGLKMPDHVGSIFLGILIILFSYLMVEWTASINQDLVRSIFGKSARQWIEQGESNVNGTLQNILDMRSPKDLLVSIVLVGLLAAVGEELFFRGILQRIMIQIFRSPWIGIVVTAAIFSAIHGQFLGFIPRMILGVILGFLYWYSGSLFPAMAGHFVFNTLQILLVYYKVIDLSPSGSHGESVLAIAGILALAAVIALLNYMRKKSLTTYERVYHMDAERF